MATNVKKADEKRLTEVKGRATAFFRGSWAELKKVHWPSRKELITYTAVVLISVAFISLLIWLTDSVLSFTLEKLFELVGKA